MGSCLACSCKDGSNEAKSGCWRRIRKRRTKTPRRSQYVYDESETSSVNWAEDQAYVPAARSSTSNSLSGERFATNDTTSNFGETMPDREVSLEDVNIEMVIRVTATVHVYKEQQSSEPSTNDDGTNVDQRRLSGPETDVAAIDSGTVSASNDSPTLIVPATSIAAIGPGPVQAKNEPRLSVAPAITFSAIESRSIHKEQRLSAMPTTRVDAIDSGIEEKSKSNLLAPIVAQSRSSTMPNMKYVFRASSRQRLNDFDLLKVIATGTYSDIIFARSKKINDMCVVKVIRKDDLLKLIDVHKCDQPVWIEKKALVETHKHPLFIHLMATFQNKSYLFYVMDVAIGDLFELCTSQESPFGEIEARFYIAELLVAIQYLHKKGIIHRDIKVENVLISRTGHVQLCDLGVAKQLGEEDRTNTIVGTPHYMAPEILQGEEYNRSVDYWSLGILSHELVNLASPFYRDNVDEIQDAILDEEYHPDPDSSVEMKKFLLEILQKDPSKRLGMIEERRPIRRHEYFQGVDWRAAEEGRLRPPIIPDAELPDLPKDQPRVNLAPVELNAEQRKLLHHFDGFDWVSEEFAQRSVAASIKLEETIACSKTDNKTAARRFTI